MTELLLATLFAGIAISILFSFYRDQLFRLLSQETRLATLEDARGALDLMTRELRNAGVFPAETDESCTKDASGRPLGIIDPDSSSLYIQADLDGDGDCSSSGESVSYVLSEINPACSIIKRNEQALVGYCPEGQGTRQVSVTVPDGSLFTFFDASDTPLVTSIGPLDPDTIRRVRIAMAIEERNPDPRVGGILSTALSSSVTLRN